MDQWNHTHCPPLASTHSGGALNHCPTIHEDVAKPPQRPHSATQPRNVVSLPDISKAPTAACQGRGRVFFPNGES
jgi:hypothetical protein